MRRMLLVLLVFTAPACGGDLSSADSDAGAVLTIHTSAGNQRFSVEVADTPAARERGLMGRETLAPFDGMVFTWSDPVRTSFWMKDTQIPLSIAFWDEHRRIVAMFEMEPCTANPCPTYDPGVEILGAVELGRGVLDRRGVEIGDEVDLTLPA